jgi:hypothetical protein
MSAVFSHLFRNIILYDSRHLAPNLAIPLNHQNLGEVTGITTSTCSDSFPKMMLLSRKGHPTLLQNDAYLDSSGMIAPCQGFGILFQLVDVTFLAPLRSTLLRLPPLK